MLKQKPFKGEGLRVRSCLRNYLDKNAKYLIHSQDEKGPIVVDMLLVAIRDRELQAR